MNVPEVRRRRFLDRPAAMPAPAATQPVAPIREAWTSAKATLPQTGPCGVTYIRTTVEFFFPPLPLDCLLWRDAYGVCRALLLHYPDGAPGHAPPGYVGFMVDPHWRPGSGIATVLRGAVAELADEALRHFDIDPAAQIYTRAGVVFLRYYRRRLLRSRKV